MQIQNPDIVNVNRIFKSLRHIFLLFAGVVIISHLIIPHDHHFSIQNNSLKDSCQMPDEKSGRHPLLPAHCYAFNDLTAEKSTPLKIIRQLDQTGFATVIWFPDYLIPGQHISQTVLPASDKPFQQIYITDFFPFRAPPCLS